MVKRQGEKHSQLTSELSDAGVVRMGIRAYVFKLPVVIKTFVLSIFERSFYTGLPLFLLACIVSHDLSVFLPLFLLAFKVSCDLL